MNRLKLWVFALLVVAAAAVVLRVVTLQLRAEALAAVDARVVAGGARAAVQNRALLAEVGAVAHVAALDPRLVEALREPAPLSAAPAAGGPGAKKGKLPEPPPPLDPAALDRSREDALGAAVTAAQAALAVGLPPGSRRLAANRESLARLRAAPPEGDAEVLELLGAAVDGQSRHGAVTVGGRLWQAAAAPAAAGAGLVLLAPVDASWAASAVAGSGAELAITAPGAKLVATGAARDAELVVGAALSAAGGPVSAGRLAPARLKLLGVTVPEATFLFGDPAPALRALALPLPGVKAGWWVVSAPTAPALYPVLELQWAGLASLAVLLVLGFLFGLLVHPTEVAARLPPELVQAADRISRGDFSARAPQFAGQLGTVADALNRAAAAIAAQAGQAASSGSITQEFFAGQPGTTGPAEPEGDPFQFAARPQAAAVLGGGAFEAAPVAAAPPPRAPPSAAPAPAAPPSAAPAPRAGSTGTAPAFPSAPAFPVARPPEPAAPHGDPAEDAAWRQVFRDFVETREACGEPAEGLTWEKFRLKLDANKAVLVGKYACRTVRFQVYVKEGKAALKATPVR